jgi:hypothetical protein
MYSAASWSIDVEMLLWCCWEMGLYAHAQISANVDMSNPTVHHLVMAENDAN